MLTWNRGVIKPLSQNFSTKEFTCPCGICRDQRVSKALIDKLQRIRDVVGPITVTSGFRCALYQEALKKRGYKTAKKSMHLEGQAADIVAADMDKLLEECEKEFQAIGIAKNFLHVDLRTDKKRRWAY